MESSNAIAGGNGTLGGSVRAIVEQALQTPLPMWQRTTLAQLTSTRATLAADGRVDATIRGMAEMQAWNIDADLADSANSALGGVLGSAAGLSQLVHGSAGMATIGSRTIQNGDGTVTVASTLDHDAGVAKVMARFDADSAAPAESSAAWLAALLGQRGEAVNQNMAAFSTNLPRQIPDFVQAGAASSALGASLVVNLPAFF